MWLRRIKKGWLKIWRSHELVSIEWMFGLLIFSLKQFTFTEIVFNCRRRWRKRQRSRFIDWYNVVATGVLLCVFLWWSDCTVLRWLAVYVLAGTIVSMTNNVFLTKILGEPVSNQRTLLLFVINVIQLLLTFAIFYKSRGISDALFWAVMVFGTLDWPKEKVNDIVAGQVAVDFFLLAIYLAFVVGDLRRRSR